MKRSFMLSKIEKDRFLIRENNEILGYLVCKMSDETVTAFSYDFGSVFGRESFTNIDNFTELNTTDYYAIEYLTLSEEQRLQLNAIITQPEKALPMTGIIIECYKSKGKLKMKIISSGYNNWNVRCAIPIKIRKEGDKYLVEKLIVSKKGGFYQAYGKIEKVKI